MNLLESISLETGLSISDVERIIRTAPARYKHYQIPKAAWRRPTNRSAIERIEGSSALLVGGLAGHAAGASFRYGLR